ncbi:MAG: hypothetical protein Q9183_006035, partial [Haloplaca sp. 2 TL-2023]
MAPQQSNKKRKAVTRDAPEADEVALSDGGEDIEAGFLDGILSQSEDEGSIASGSEDSDEDEEDEDVIDGLEDDLESDEVPSEGGESDGVKLNGSTEHAADNEDHESVPNHIVTEDANGNERYVYKDIDPVYDSDDSEAPQTTNTIGNIPLSFYDSYPHIGYDINGKKIARPAKGEALDTLLDSIDIPK